MIKGRCECSKIQYEVSGDLVEFCHCHCSICRKLHGAAFVSWGGVKRAEFKYLSGENHLRAYSFSENADSLFCGSCGSGVLVDFKPEEDMLYITMGTVTSDIKCPKGFHIFVGSKAPWFEISDDLPQFHEWSDEP